MLRLIFSNHLDELALALAGRAAPGAGDALQPMRLVVPSLGIGRWLKYRLAAMHGIAAGIDAQYPAQFIWREVERALPGVAAASPVPGERLRWLIDLWLAERGAAIEPLAAITREPLNRWQLATRLARLFGEYLVYRPQWLRAWVRGEMPAALHGQAHAAWQGALWRWLAEQTGLGDQPHPFELYFATPAAAADAAEVHLFALPSLAPLYVEFFAQLSLRREVTLYALSPSREYWGQIVDARGAGGDESLVGHPLLAAWGKAQRDFHDQLAALGDAVPAEDEPHFRDRPGASLLARLQRDLLELDVTTAPAAADDRSVQVHACHSLLRQVEVLHDLLLDAFRRDPALRPQDVAVFACDIAAAAPLVRAVFGTAQPSLPYTIGGVADSRSEALTAAWMSLLAPAQSTLGRMQASAVLGLLRQPAVAAAFDLDIEEVEQLQRWAREAGIHRDPVVDDAADAAAAARHGWHWGIARLLLGVLQADEAAALAAGVLPVAEVEAADVPVLEKLLRYVAQLRAWRERIAVPMPLAQWSAVLAEGLERFFAAADDATQDWLLLARRLCAELPAHAPQAMRSTPVPAAVVRAWLAEQLRAAAPGAVPAGAVTVAPLGDLRGVPYAQVYVIGCEADVFPRREPVAEYDLLRQQPQRGDRSRRLDDRGAFLDALLAAERQFAVLYCGRDAATNDELPPAAPVGELLAMLARMTGLPAQHWLHAHPLQPFSAAAFDPQWPSYSAHGHAVAQVLLAARRDVAGDAPTGVQPVPWLALGPLPGVPPAADGESWMVDELAAQIAEPTRWFVRQRLGVRFADDDVALTDDPPAALSGFERWRLRARLLAATERFAPDDAVRIARAGPELPSGVAGDTALHDALAAVQAHRDLLKNLIPSGVKSQNIEFASAFGNVQAEVYICGERWVSARFSRLKLRDVARAVWLQALRCAAGGPSGALVHTATDGVLQLAPWPAAEARQLLDGWQQAARCHREACVLLPSASAWAYLRPRYLEGRDEDEAIASGLRKAREAWAGNDRQPGEAQDALWQALLGGESAEWPDGWQPLCDRLFGAALQRASLHTPQQWLQAAGDAREAA